MADDEIMIEDDAIALEDTDDTVTFDDDVSNIIPFIMEKYQRLKTTATKMKSGGFVLTEITEVSMGQTCSLLSLKSLVSLSK